MTKSCKSVVIASGNTGKIQEFKAILKDFDLVSQSEFNTIEAVENGLSFVENAIIKARNAAKFANLPAIADDSGLVVDSLGGEPGIFSARYSDGNDKDNIKKLLKNMTGVKNRSARFYCVIAFVKNENDPAPILATGSWEGEILEGEIGTNGFGYDSVFFVPEKNCSSAELSSAEKNKISHRAKALQKFKEEFKEKFNVN
jgi:XTP/dITP diphosphohydrolase